MSTRSFAAIAAALLVLTVAGCAPGSAGGDAAGDGGGDAGGGDSGGDSSALNCDGADLSGGWDLFVDPELTIDPAVDGVVSLQSADDVLHFTYAATEEYTTYGYQLGYIDDEGTIFPNRGAILFPDGHPDAPDDNVFTIAGPLAASSVDGGPYAGVLQIDRTDSTGTKIVASICVALALTE